MKSSDNQGKENLKAETDKQEIEKDELIRATINSSTDMIQVFKAVRNDKGEIVDFVWILNNKTSENYYGDVIGKSLLTLNPGVVKEGIFDTFKKVVETGVPDQSERHYMHEQFDGWFYQSTTKLDDGVATTTKDITAYKKAEQDLSESKSLLQSILDVSLTAISHYKAIRDSNNQIVNFEWVAQNKTHKDFNGGRDLIGKRILDIHPGLLKTGVFERYIQVTETGISQDFEVHYTHEGYDSWYRTIIVKLGDGIVTSSEDITHRKKNEKDLIQSTQLLETVVNNTASSIMLLKPIRNEANAIIDFEYLFTNLQTLTSINRETLEGKYFTQEFPGEKDSDLLQSYIKVIETGISYQTEVNIAPIGPPIWTQLFARKTGDALLVTYVDITERKKSAQEILQLKDEIAQKATDKYLTLFNSIDQGFALCELIRNEEGKGVDYRIIELNPAFERQTGLHLETFVGRTAREVFPALDKWWIDSFSTTVDNKQPVSFEHYLKEVQRWYEIGAYPMKNDQFAILYNNITERKRREGNIALLNEVNESLMHVKNIDETMNTLCEKLGMHFGAEICAFSEVDEEKETLNVRYVWHLPGTASPSGIYNIKDYYSKEAQELMQSNKPYIMHDRTMFTKVVADHIAALNIGTYINLPFVRENQWRATLTIADNKPREWSDDEIELMRELSFRILTRLERVRADEALRKSEEQLRLAINTAKTVVWTWDIKENKIETTSNFKDIYGMTSIEFSQQGFNLVYPDDREPHLQKVQNASTNGGGYYSQFRIIRPDNGQRIWLEERADSVLNEDGKVIKLIGASIEITGLKQAEDALRTSEKTLKELNENLERLVKKRTRELTQLKLKQEKEKLNAVVFMQEQERARIGEGLHDGVAQLLYAAQNRLQLLAPANEADLKELKTVHDILAEAILDTRNISFELMPQVLKDYGLEVSLKSLVRRIIPDQLQLHIELNIPARLSEKLEITTYRIVQEILNNILKHAQATQAGLKIYLSEKDIHVKAFDNGIGFLAKKSKRVLNGTGLQNISSRVKLLDGKMKIASQPGKGTTIELQLPYKKR